MRILIDIADADLPFIENTKQHCGVVVIASHGQRAIKGSVIATVEPNAVVGAGNRGTALYDITLLDDL